MKTLRLLTLAVVAILIEPSCTVALKDGTVVQLDGDQAAKLAAVVADVRDDKAARNVQP